MTPQLYEFQRVYIPDIYSDYDSCRCIMPDTARSYQSYNYLYTRIWLVCSFILITLRFLLPNQNQRGYILMAYMALSWISLGGVSFYEGHRLAQYLSKYRPELVKRGRYGFGLTGFDGWRLLWMTDAIVKSNDTTAIWLLDNYKNFVTLQVLVFVSYPVLFVLTLM